MPRIITWIITLMLCQWALQVAGKTPVSPSLVKKFVRYTELSSAGYAKDCRVPPQGVKIISRIRAHLTNTDGFLAMDEVANELVVVLRGTDNLPDVLTDIKIRKVPYKSEGVSECPGCKVHEGFLNSWESIAKDVLRQVKGIVNDNPDIRVTVTGHSLGASLASLAAMSLIGSGINVTTYTFGQPRTGNRAFAEYVDKQAPPGTMYRVTHANDGIPQIFPTVIGYRHHSTEYW